MLAVTGVDTVAIDCATVGCTGRGAGVWEDAGDGKNEQGRTEVWEETGDGKDEKGRAGVWEEAGDGKNEKGRVEVWQEAGDGKDDRGESCGVGKRGVGVI